MRKHSGVVRAALAIVALLAALVAPAASAGPAQPGGAGLAAALLPPIADRGSSAYLLSADGRHVVYAAGDDRVSGYYGAELFSVPVDGSAPPRLLAGGPGEYKALVGATAERALYLSHSNLPSYWSLLSVPLDGSAPPALLVDSVVEPYSSGLRLAGGRVVLILQRATAAGSEWQLLSLPADGSAPPTTLAALESSFVQWEVVAGDGGRVLYAISSAEPGVSGLYAVPAAGPAAARVRLSPEGAVVAQFRLSGDGAAAAFAADGRLYVAPTSGARPARAVSPALAAGQQLFNFALSPDGSAVAYGVATLAPLGNYTLQGHVYSAPSDGGGPATRLSASPIPLGSIFAGALKLVIGPDSRSVVYQGDSYQSLFAATIGAADSGRPLPAEGLVFNFRFLDPARIITTAPSVAVIPLDPAAPPVRLSPPGARTGYALSVVGGRALFATCDEPCRPTSGGISLLSVPLTGPASAAARLATWYREAELVRFEPAAGGRVVYAADSDERPGLETYSVPVAPLGVGFALSSTTLPEGDPGTIEVRLDGAADAPVVVGYRVDGLGMDRRGSLSFAPGVISQTIELQLAADGRFTGDRLLRLALAPPEGVAPLLHDRVTLTLRDAEARRAWLPNVATR